MTVDQFKRLVKQQNSARLANIDADELDIVLSKTTLSLRQRILEALDAWVQTNNVPEDEQFVLVRVPVRVDAATILTSTNPDPNSQLSSSESITQSTNQFIETSTSVVKPIEIAADITEPEDDVDIDVDIDDMAMRIVTASMSTAQCFSNDATFLDRFNVLA